MSAGAAFQAATVLVVEARLAIVTGGSRGIGAATARRLARESWNVLVTYRSDEAAAHAVVEDCTRAGAGANAVRADVADETQVEQLFASLPREAGTLVCSREAVRPMSTARGGGGGAIVNVSSKAAVLGSPREYVDYAASKAAVDTITTGLDQEVADEGIRVNSVRLGLFDTEIHARNGEPGRLHRIAPTVPMKRAGSADEAAAAICWLLSDQASYSTGAHLDVSGGR